MTVLRCLLAFGLSATAVLAAEDVPLELRPYRVQVSVGLAGPTSPEFRQKLLREIEQTADRVVGSMWATRVEENRWLSPIDRLGLERLTSEELIARTDVDYAILLTVESSGAGFRLAARGWTAAIREFSPTLTADVYNAHELAPAAMRLCLQLFRPVVHIDDADDRTATFRLQGGEFPPVDPEAAALRDGDYLIPYLIYRDRDNQIERIQQLPWTCLTVTERTRGRGTATVASALRSPLSGKRRGRIEAIAVGVKPLFPATRLRLVAQGTGEPFLAHRVEISSVRPGEETDVPPTVLVTDRWGAVTLPAESPARLAWASIFSGKALLARLPLVPGSTPLSIAELPNDSLRLKAEGELALLHDRLVETVARRATMIALIQALAKRGDWPKVDEQLKELETLPNAREFQQQLSGVRVAAVEAAESAGQRLAAARIRRLCDETADLIREYLDPDWKVKLREELAELRKLDEADKAAEKSTRKSAD